MNKKILIFILIICALLWPIQGFAIPDGTGNEILIGNVGINSMAPGKQLDVQGTVRAVAYLGDGSALTNLPVAESGGGFTDDGTFVHLTTSTDNLGIGTVDASQGKLIVTGGNVGIGTTTPGGALVVMNGNVGVGTWLPTAPLHVNGQCVTGDTRLRRRRRKKNGQSLEDGSLTSNSECPARGLEDFGDDKNIYDYDEVRIDQVEPGDEILSLNEETGRLEYQRVNALMDMGVKDIYKLTTASGKTIRTTGNHPYLRAPNTIEHQYPNGVQFGFIDETGISASEDQPVFAVGMLTMDDTINISRELHDVFTGVVSKYSIDPSRFEFKFNGITTNNLPFYKKIIRILSKQKNWQFDATLVEKDLATYKPQSFWEYYLKGVATLLNNDNSPIVLVGDYLAKPKSASVDLELLRQNSRVCNIIQLESEGALLLQATDILLGALSYLQRLENNPKAGYKDPKKELALMVKDLLNNRARLGNVRIKKFAVMEWLHAAIDNPKPQPEINKSIPQEAFLSREAQSLVKGGTWTKVSELKEGDSIATLSSSNASSPLAGRSLLLVGDPEALHAIYERITKIELLPPEQVWDVEIANTHNFVGNDIIAHNTYLNGNVGIGTTSPTTALTLGSGQITVPNGTVSAPSYAFTNYSNYGFYADSNGIQWSSAGVNGGRFTNSGLLVRTAVILGDSADVRLGYLSAGVAQIYNGTVDAFRDLKLQNLIATGNVGVGSVNPTQKLDVNGTVKATYFSGDGSALTNLPAAASGGGFTDDGTIVHLTTSTDNLGIGTVDASNGKLIVTGGNVGIGSTVPNHALLELTGDGAKELLRINDVGPDDTTPFVVSSSGNVGIGTTSPSTKLNITPSASGNTVLIHRLGDGTGNAYWGFGTSNTSNTDQLIIGHSGAAYAGAAQWIGASNAFLYYPTTFRIGTGVGTTPTMSFTSTGNVGIGTTSPVSNLHVATAVTTNTLPPTYRGAIVIDSGMTNAAVNGLEFKSYDSAGVGYGWREATIFDGGSYVDFRMQSRQNSSTWTDWLTIKGNNGNVGIGTVNPGEKLEVNAGYIYTNAGLGAINNGVQTASGIKLGSDSTPKAPIIANWRGATSDNQGIDIRTYSTGYIDALRILGNGNVGIGTTVPSGLLEVGAQKFNVLTGGNVGVGSITPGQKLDVQGTVRATYFSGDGSALTNLPATSSGWTLGASNVGISTTNNVGIGTNLTTTAALTVMSGNVGIGTTVPTTSLEVSKATTGVIRASAAQLPTTYYAELYGNYAGSDLGGVRTSQGNLVRYSVDNIATQLGIGDVVTIKNGGNVGIGTTLPESALHVGVAGSAVLTLQRIDTSLSANDPIGKIQFYAKDTSTTTNMIVADIEAQATNTVGSDINPGRLIFRTTPTTVAATPLDRMIINENGNVGIGTTSPLYPFDVASASGIGLTATSGGVIGNTSSIVFSRSSPYNILTLTSLGGPAAAGWSGKINFNLAYNAGTAYTAMTILDNAGSGNVGIGTTLPSGLLEVGAQKFNVLTGGNVGVGSITPGQKLDVQGTVRASYFSGDGSGLTNVTAASGGGFTDDGTVVHLTTSSDNVGIGTVDASNGKLIVTGGNVGIGSTVPNHALLELTGDGAKELLRINDVGPDDTTPFVVSSSGYVGIGTSSPSSLLSVNLGTETYANNGVYLYGSGSESPKLTLQNTGTGGKTYKIISTHNNSAFGGGSLVFADPSVGARIVISTGGNVGIGTTLPSGLFEVGLQKFNVLTGGNVGVGSITPGQKLDVQGTVRATYFSGDGSALTNLPAAASGGGFTDDGTVVHLTTSTDNLGIGTVDVSQGKLIVTGGNVGIGTTTPGSNLSVLGGGSFGTYAINPSPAGGIITSGNVGIGTTVPNSLLSLKGSSPKISFRGSSSSIPGLVFYEDATDKAYMQYIGSGVGLAGRAGNLEIETQSGVSLDIRPGSSSKIMILSTGNVGIGTTIPASLLDVTGGLTTTGAVLTLGTKEPTVVASDILGRINFYAPLEADLSDSILTGASIAALAEGDFGAASNATSLLFQTGSSETATTKMTITSAGNVGIGTTVPSFPLSFGRLVGNKIGLYDVGGGSGYGFGIQSNLLQIFSESSSADITFGYGNSSSLTRNVTFRGNGNVGIGTTLPSGLLEVGAQKFNVLTGGNVGVGSITPGQKLDVQGTVRATYFSGDGSALTGVSAGGFTDDGTIVHLTTSSDNLGIGTVDASQGKLIVTGGNVGIGSTVPNHALLELTGDGAKELLRINDVGPNDISPFVVTSSGNVGIGTWVPSQQLELTNSLKFPATTSSTTGVIYKGADRFIHDFTASGTTGWNTFVGVQAGNLTLTGSSSGNQGSVNTAVGYQALKGLTTGQFNTAVGSLALSTESTSDSNTAVGYSALGSANNTYYNTAVGYQSIANGGHNNSALGYRTLANATGAYNIALGSQAGFNLTTGTNNIIIGYNMDAPYAGGTYQMTLGNLIYGTNINGSGTTVSTGNIGIGTWTPVQKLDVSGTVKATAFVGDGSALTNLPGGASGWTLGASNVGISTTNNVGIGTNLTTTAALTVMSGNVGIGTWVPAYTLDIKGDGRLTSNLTVTGGLLVSNNSTLAGTTATQFATPLLFNTTAEWDVVTISTGYFGMDYDNSETAAFFAWGKGGTTKGASTVLMTLTEGGNLGIGTSVPSGALGVVGNVGIGTTTTSSFVSTAPDARGMIIEGNVGIGTTKNSSAGLSVMNGNVGMGTWKPRASLEINNPATTGNPQYLYFKNSSVTHGLTSFLPTDVFGSIGMYANDGGGLFIYGASEANSEGIRIIGGQAGSNPNDGQASIMIFGAKQSGAGLGPLGDDETVLQIYSGGTTSGAKPPFTIMGSMNVGIGTVIPGGALTVMSGNVGIGTWKPVGQLQVNNPTSINSPFIIDNAGNVGIGTNLTTTAALTVMNGNVGIGTWKPSSALAINGAITNTTITLSDGANIATNAALGNYFRVTLAGDRTLDNPTNGVDGQKIVWEIIQDATGTRTLALDTKFTLGTDITSTTLTTTASKRDFLGAIYNSTTDKWYVVSFVKGY